LGMTLLPMLLWPIARWLFGPRGSIKGGALGLAIHQLGSYYARYRTVTRWREEVRSLNLAPGQLTPEPWFWRLDCLIRSRPNYAVVEMLLREKRRVERLESMVRATKTSRKSCLEDGGSLVFIPRVALQLLARHKQPTLPPHWIVRDNSVEVDSMVIRDSDMKPPLSEAIENCHARSDAARLQCAAHHLGGMQLSNSPALHRARPLISRILSLIGSPKRNPHDVNLGGGACDSRLGYAVLSELPALDDGESRKESSASSLVSTVFAAFPPDHPGSLCMPPLDQTVGISPRDEADEGLGFRSMFANKILTEVADRDSDDATGSTWGFATLLCDVESAGGGAMMNCCNRAKVTVLESADAGEIEKHLRNENGRPNNKHNHHLIFALAKTANLPKEGVVSRDYGTGSTSVRITERPRKTREPVPRRKVSIQARMRHARGRCEPSWRCNRCLRLSLHGSFSRCPSCGRCAVDAICDAAGRDALSEDGRVEVDVRVVHRLPGGRNPGAANFGRRRNRIPQIIHQTYFEEITAERHPQLFRLQNTWRNSGWEYRFYDDDAARGYVEANYPGRFVSAFDSLLHGAYKADFFRYLVLYKEGGVYADVDVMLNTNLDNFITPDLGFFAQLDAIGNFADEPFCLWNGMLGAAPAHPVLTNVIEWTANLVTRRGDMYDMERAVCRRAGAGGIENWKVRAEPLLLLSGPCALGLAANGALGNEPLARFEVGLLKREGFNAKNVEGVDGDAVGDVLLLLADKDDLGAFRFSDPERNILVASTELAGLSKSRMMYEGDRQKGSDKRPHYSISVRGQQLWGTHDVYVDYMDVDEEVSLIVSHE